MKKKYYYCSKCKRRHYKEKGKIYEEHNEFDIGKTSEEEGVKLLELIIKTRDKLADDFDMLEFIEGELETVFECNLDCSTCTREEQGACLQSFKRGNIFWLMKIAQDEWVMKDVVTQLDKLRELITELYEEVRASLKDVRKMKKLEDIKTKVDYRDKTEEEKDKNVPSYVS